MNETTSPMTAGDVDLSDPSTVYNACLWRMTATDQQWKDSPGLGSWDLSRDEAARRLDDEDYSDPFGD